MNWARPELKTLIIMQACQSNHMVVEVINWKANRERKNTARTREQERFVSYV